MNRRGLPSAPVGPHAVGPTEASGSTAASGGARSGVVPRPVATTPRRPRRAGFVAGRAVDGADRVLAETEARLFALAGLHYRA